MLDKRVRLIKEEEQKFNNKMMREMRAIHEFNIKEEQYIDKLNSKGTPLPQMFTEYFNFKMEMHKLRTQKELEN